MTEPRPVGRSRFTLSDAAFALVTVVTVYYRYRVLRAGGAPPTIDAGNWLAYGDQMFGADIRSPSIVYPPIVPMLVKASTAMFGLAAGVSLIAATAAAAPAIGTYAMLRSSGSRPIALSASLLLLGATSIGEAAAWGGFPQLIGLGLLPPTLLLIDGWTRIPSHRAALTAGMAVAAVAGTSHFILALVALGGLALIVFNIRSDWRPAPASIALLVLPSLWLIPTYLGLARGFLDSPRDATFFNELTAATVVDRVEFLYRDSPWLWRALFIAALVAIVGSAWRRLTASSRISAALLLATGAVLLLTRESRFLYALTPLAAIGVTLWAFDRHGERRTGLEARALVGLLLVAASWQLASGIDFFRSQRDNYGILTPELVDGFEQVAASTESTATIAVTSLRDAPIGWWVEAITHRDVIYGAPIGWLLFEDEIRRAAEANEIFVPPFPNDNRISAAAESGIDLILVPTDWVFYDAVAVDDFDRRHPGAVRHITTELITIDPGLVSR